MLVILLVLGVGHAQAGSRSERELARLATRATVIEVQDSVTGGCLPKPGALSAATASQLTGKGLEVADTADISNGDYLYSIHAIGGRAGEACAVTLHIEVARVAELAQSEGGYRTIVLAISAVVPFISGKDKAQASAEQAVSQVAEAVATSAADLKQQVEAGGAQ